MFARTPTAYSACLALSLAACGGDGAADGDLYERPPGARDAISDRDLASLEEVGAVIHEGLNPPEIAGVYDLAGGTVVYHDHEEIEGTEVCAEIWTVESTDRDDFYLTSSESYGNCSGSSAGVGSYISGRDGCFTLFSLTSGERDGCEYESMRIRSGCLTTGGIADMGSAGLGGAWVSVQAGACEALINNGLMPAEGERDILDRGFVERVED